MASAQRRTEQRQRWGRAHPNVLRGCAYSYTWVQRGPRGSPLLRDHDHAAAQGVLENIIPGCCHQGTRWRCK